MVDEDELASGHRIVPHTADVALEAWAPGRSECIAEAVRGLVESFVDITGVTPSGTAVFDLAPEDDEELLIDVLEEVIYRLDVHNQIPVDVEVEEAGEEEVEVRLAVTSADRVELTGAIPKAVSLYDLEFRQRAGRWWCRATVDV